MVALRLREAWDTLRRLPASRVQGFRSAWPATIRDALELEGGALDFARLSSPTPRAIDRMHEVFGWFVHLKDQPHLTVAVWLTCARGMGPARAGAIIGVHRDTVRRRRDEALDRIVAGERRRAAA